MAKKTYLKFSNSTSLKLQTEEGKLNNLLCWAELVKFFKLKVQSGKSNRNYNQKKSKQAWEPESNNNLGKLN